MKSSIFAVAAIIASTIGAQGQIVTPTVNGTDYLATVTSATAGFGGVCTGPGGECVSPSTGIPLNYYATSSDVASSFSSTNAQLASQLGSINSLNSGVAGLNTGVNTLNGQYASLSSSINSLNNQYAAISTQLNALSSQLNRAFDGAAMGIAMKDAIPDDGDKFAVRINMGGFEGHAAGGISFTANVADKVHLMLNYGQSRTQSAFGGGLNFSFN